MWLSDLGATVQGYALAPERQPALFDLAGIGAVVAHETGDIRDFDRLMAVFHRFRPEVVFHLAAQALVRRSYREPRATFDTNVGGTVNVLEAVRRTDSVRAAIVVTSDKCYENREWVWGYREADQLGGHDPYSASKGAAELVVTAYQRSFFSSPGSGRPTGIASARAGNVIGGGDFAEDRIVPDAIRSVIVGEPLRVRNPGSVRPWQHVLDALGGYLLLGARLWDEPARYSGAWNFGPNNRDALAVSNVVERLFKSLGRGAWTDVSAKQRPGLHEARTLWLCCDKAATELGWEPAYSFGDAIDATGAWYRRVTLEQQHALTACKQDLGNFETRASLLPWWCA